MASYFELKQKIATKTETKSSSKGTSYFDLKAKASKTIEVSNSLRQRQQEELARKQEEERAALEAEQNKPTFMQKAGELAKEAGKGIAKGLIRPFVSLAEVPLNVASGGEKTFGDFNVPGLGKINSYQEATRQAQDKVISGEKPLLSVLAPAAEGVLDVAGMGVGSSVIKQGAKQGVKQAFKQGAKEGAAYGAGYGGVQAAEEGKGLKESAKTVAMSTVFGGLLAGGLGAGTSKISSKFRPQDAADSIGEIEKIFNEKPTFQETKQIIESLKKGTSKEEIIGAVKQAAKDQGIEVLEPRILKAGELAPAVKRIEEKTKKLSPSEALSIKTELERGVSEEAIVKNMIDTGEVKLKVMANPMDVPTAIKYDQPAIVRQVEQIPEIKVPKVEVAQKAPKIEELTYESLEGTSGLAKSVKAKAIKDKMIYGFDRDFRELPTYEKRIKSDDMSKATDFVLSDYKSAEKVIFEGAKPPKDMLPEDVFVAMNAHATATKDVEMIRRLANESGLTGEATLMGQRIQALSQLNPDSALSNMQKVAKERISKVEKKAGKKIDKVKAEVADEIKKETRQSLPTKQDWSSFIESIKC